MVGRTVLHYQLLEKLGAGGMGEIFKAQDTRLNRFVAVKVLSATGGGGDIERRRRFTQEAQAASALNHPNIITIHDIISDGDTDYMVMEYVAGKTLVDVIPKGGLRAPQVLKYSVQMADALNAAHTAGIIHRDLKPGNIMVTDSGLIKVLDFGLAKLTDRGPLSQMGEDTGDDQTRTIAHAPLTVEGSIIGTVSYMSPEQAQGKKVDTRSDIFSFGVVLYEMTTGVRAFPGDSALSTLSAILRDEVRPLVEAAPEAPPQLDMVIQRCLRKNPDERWQTMKDVQMALSALKHESDSGMLYRARLADIPAAPSAPPPQPPAATTILPAPALVQVQANAAGGKKSSPMLLIGAIAGVVVLAAAGGIGWRLTHKNPVDPPAPVVQTPPPTPVAVVQPDPAPVAPPENVLTNDSVIDMIAGKVPVSLVLSQIRSEKTNFVLNSTEIIRLTKAGVPEKVIEGMRDPKKIPEQAVSTPSTTPVVPQTKQVAAITNKQQAPAVTPTPTPTPQSPQPVAVTPVTPPPQPVAVPVTPVAARATTTASLVDGSPFSILLAGDIPVGIEAGTPVRFTVAKDYKVGDSVVIAKGASVTGAIVDPGGKKFLGMGNKMTLRVDQTESTSGQKIALRAAPARRAEGTTRPVETGVKSRSKEAVASDGTEYIAYIDGDQKVSVKK
jgi:serine/threonine protein kinase